MSIGLLGAAAYRVFLYHSRISWIGNVFPWIPLATFAVSIALFTTVPPASMLFRALTVNYLDRSPSFIRRFLSFPIMRWFGKCSFSIYVWQQPFYMYALDHPESSPWLLALALLVCTASFYLFENPVRTYLNRAWDRHLRSRSLRAAPAAA
jgi:peptidoglycan/LPS O-acetylase OafA/YrhL